VWLVNSLDASALIGLWDESPLDDPYMELPPSEALVPSIEEQLGYLLPSAYKELARLRNGGLLRRNAHPCPRPTTWAQDHVAVTGIFAVGRSAEYSLCGGLGQALWLDEWGYPPLGVYFADTPSAGHDMLALDYRQCGPVGEPAVVHVDQEVGYVITPIAPTFHAFIAGLVVADDAFLLD
jgi:hypothetical protein